MNWEPFKLCPPGEHPQVTRSIQTPDGITDRIRAAAFAEIQAREAFLWAADRFDDAPDRLKKTWRILARAEQKHLDWLLARLTELGSNAQERSVSDYLWHSLVGCQTAEEFAIFMANAEARGQKAGMRFHQALSARDPVTAQIFLKIAEEEEAHIRVATRFYPEAARKAQLYLNPTSA